MADDIDGNPFFQALKTTFQKVYNDAAENQRTVVVPHSRSFELDMLDLGFIESHILTASPYFAGQYVTPNGKCCEMDDGTSSLVTASGYTEQGRVAKIVSENVFYNKCYKAYRVLIADSALEGPQRRVKQEDQEELSDIVPLAERSFQRLLQFLVSFAGIELALQRIDMLVSNFNRTYEIVEGWEEQVGRHCEEMCHRAKDLVFGISSVNHYASGGAAHLEIVEEAVESYVMGGVHDKVFQEIAQAYGAQDRQLARMLVACTILPEEIGVRSDLCQLSIEPAVLVIAGLAGSGVITPREKLAIIQKTTTLLTRLAESHLAKQGKTSSDHALTTDDLLPLLCMTLIKAAPGTLVTHCLYLSHFNPSGTSTTELGFHLANFQAAVQFLRESPQISSEVPIDLDLDLKGSGLGLLNDHKDTFCSSWLNEDHAANTALSTSPPFAPLSQELPQNHGCATRSHARLPLGSDASNGTRLGLGDFLDALIDEGSSSISSRQFYSQTQKVQDSL